MAPPRSGNYVPWVHLNRLRRRARLTRQQLADKTGCHYTYICQIEAGSRTPGEVSLRRLADVFELDEFELEQTIPIPKATS